MDELQFEFVNLTPHEIVVRVGDKEIRIKPSGNIARCEVKQREWAYANGIPVVKTEYGEITGLPQKTGNHIYITSSLVASRVPEREDVVSPDTGPTAIRNEAGQIIAVTRFQKP